MAEKEVLREKRVSDHIAWNGECLGDPVSAGELLGSPWGSRGELGAVSGGGCMRPAVSPRQEPLCGEACWVPARVVHLHPFMLWQWGRESLEPTASRRAAGALTPS